MNDTSWTLKTALEQLEACSYECEGGKLENNDAFQWLKEQAETLADARRAALEEAAKVCDDFVQAYRFAVPPKAGYQFTERESWAFIVGAKDRFERAAEMIRALAAREGKG